ncbi:MAG TPA: ATP-binding protein, partial [Desulfurivibrionaceae bacterium]|nr:ATP-binding protein [Desulfurivibrionaceae bacterium]
RDLCAIQPLLAGVTVILEAGAENDLVMGSVDPLKQVFLNLVLNAADAIHCQPGTRPGLIRIRTANPDVVDSGIPSLTIDFLDNGPGFAEAELANIFDPFYTTKEPGKGTGLGLSICFTIVESLGGRIDAGTNPEGGARVSLSLPLAKSSVPSVTERNQGPK